MELLQSWTKSSIHRKGKFGVILWTMNHAKIFSILFQEMVKSLAEVAEDQYGRKVLLYLLSPRDPLHFHPDIVKVLQKGDGNSTRWGHMQGFGLINSPAPRKVATSFNMIFYIIWWVTSWIRVRTDLEKCLNFSGVLKKCLIFNSALKMAILPGKVLKNDKFILEK